MASSVITSLFHIRTAVLGICIIAIALFLSIFAYVISPDSTPFANKQILEIQARPPGFTQLFLVIPQSATTSAVQTSSWFFGASNNDLYIPVRSYKVKNESMYIERYVDEDTAVSESYALNYITNGQPNQWKNHLVTKKFFLGTDGFGRDMLSRMIIGSRVSLSVGFIAVLVSLLIGIFLGAIGGYYRGRIDAMIVWLIQVMWSMPTLLLVFAFTIIMGKGYWQIFIAVGLTMWVNVARLVRGQVMAMKNKTFIVAARVMGFSDWRIIIKHILPNIMGPILVIAASNFAAAIMIEAGLSFLGFGVQPPEPSWGAMIKENYSFILTNKPFLAIIPGFAIMVLVTAFYLLGNGLRDALDVKTNL